MLPARTTNQRIWTSLKLLISGLVWLLPQDVANVANNYTNGQKASSDTCNAAHIRQPHSPRMHHNFISWQRRAFTTYRDRLTAMDTNHTKDWTIHHTDDDKTDRDSGESTRWVCSPWCQRQQTVLLDIRDVVGKGCCFLRGIYITPSGDAVKYIPYPPHCNKNTLCNLLN